jgi:phenylpyruvate tautomerase PptA (4-oxalocrotonate tautomerase family)
VTKRIDTSRPNPDGRSTAQQARKLIMQLGDQQPLRFLIHDRDSKFSPVFDEVFRSEGIKVIPTPVQAPNPTRSRSAGCESRTLHDLPAEAIANAAGAGNYIRLQVLTPVNVLDRDKQLGVVKELTEIVAAAAGGPSYVERTWVLITESPDGGWGIAGHANTNADIAVAARAALAAD